MTLNNAYEQYVANPSIDNYDIFGSALLRYIRLFTKSTFKRRCRSEEMQDIISDAMIHVLESLPTYNKQSKFDTWVGGILKRRGLNLIRHEAKKAATPLFDGLDAFDNSPSMMKRMTLNQLIERLDPYDTLFTQLKLRGYTSAEIAERLDIPVGTADRQWKEIQAKLRTLRGGVNGQV